MYCSKCGSKNAETNKFCTSCGSELINQALDNNISLNNQTINLEEEELKKNGTISLVIGIISLIICFFLNILVIPLSIVGIVFGIKAKKRGTAGLILSIISIVIPVIIFIFFGFAFMNEFNHANYVSKYKCGNYYDNMSIDDYEQNIDFELNQDKTFIFSYNYSNNKSIIKGTYTVTDDEYDEETDSYKYVLELDANYRYIDGKKLTDPYKTKYGLLLQDNGAALLMNTVTNNTYVCEKVD